MSRSPGYGNSLAVVTMTLRSSFSYDRSTGRGAPVHAYAVRGRLRHSAMIGAAPFRTRIGRGRQYSSRQTSGDRYQKYSRHLDAFLVAEPGANSIKERFSVASICVRGSSQILASLQRSAARQRVEPAKEAHCPGTMASWFCFWPARRAAAASLCPKNDRGNRRRRVAPV